MDDWPLVKAYPNLFGAPHLGSYDEYFRAWYPDQVVEMDQEAAAGKPDCWCGRLHWPHVVTADGLV